MKKGLYIGRFQPFHLGHLSIVKRALKEVDFLYIGIGSSQFSHEPENPFTAKEREEMIKRALITNNIKEDKFEIIKIPDIDDFPAWPAHVRSITPSFDILFLGNTGVVKELFEKHDSVEIKVMKHTIKTCSTDIREKMERNENWREFLDESTVGYLEEIDGMERIEKINTV